MKKFIVALFLTLIMTFSFASTYKVEKIEGTVLDILNNIQLTEGLIIDESTMIGIAPNSYIEISSEDGTTFIFDKPCRKERIIALIYKYTKE